MNIEAKVKNPIRIRLKKNKSVILKTANWDTDYPLNPGVVLGGEHYGFIVIIDYNNTQKEIVYKTQCKLQMLGIENGKLKVYEEYKKTPWIIDQKTGTSEKSAYNAFTNEGLDKIITEAEDYDVSYDEPIFKNPIKIEYDYTSKNESRIILDETEEAIPIKPGVILKRSHYGFIITIKTTKGKTKISYPTENRIDAVGGEDEEIAGKNYLKIKVYENGKYHPWIINPESLSSEDLIAQESHYNQFSRRDQEFIKKRKRKNSTV